MVAEKQYKVIGTRPIRPDGTDKVTGRAQYGADVKMTGMLYGRVVRSPHAHARIKKIDASKALKLPGVKAVITAADFPPPPGGVAQGGEGPAQPIRFMVENFMASEKAVPRPRHRGRRGNRPAHRRRRAGADRSPYEVLQPVIDVREAMAAAAPILHDDLRTKDAAPLSTDTPTDKATNIAAHLQLKRGDTDQGFADSDVVIEREYTTQMYHQGYIELHTATAYWNRDGALTVWNSSQAPHNMRQQLSTTLNVPLSKVTVVPLEIGGGFGGNWACTWSPGFPALERPVSPKMTTRAKRS